MKKSIFLAFMLTSLFAFSKSSVEEVISAGKEKEKEFITNVTKRVILKEAYLHCQYLENGDGTRTLLWCKEVRL
ncbi:hypothetical protein ACE1MK_13835 [Tenacibaculum maritimum]|uniref:hypothetical protein n=1 Tax=Tenacibaculum maritimum TaxID=107401 RepID=UPI0012E6E68E|nr:hypothetical protein [Tenacibaculum maritimum]MCD9582204.1 hypothetical protein [Tenacibaculum maritimum]MCD9636583.1 hypothetical protein [Tenacibaculum maritimum]CAA0169481.1 exported hypothetical protein [Tenacibaculum maritimum]CAA0213332.1 hypothetical protein USCSE301_370029 [Tenacibaculum maritimum]CAA0237871.1 exported hypothetical protein [Tenacibaculum maritimum]